MKKVISVFLAVLMLVTMLPLSVFAENTSGVLDRGNCGANGDNLTWTLYNDGELLIEGNGRMYGNVMSSSDSPWYFYKEQIISVTICNGVKSISQWAFHGHDSLTSISIPDSVTSIGNSAFEYCKNLTSITIPAHASIGNYAFLGCDSLTMITVDENNAYYSSDEYGVLFNKTKTEIIQYPAGNNQTEYTIPDSVTTIGEFAFSFCNNLTAIIIPKSVKLIDYSAFRYCYSLLNIKIPDSVTSIGSYAFSSCNSLVSITIPDSVTSIGHVTFEWCKNLENVTVDDNNMNYSSDKYGVLFNKDKTELIQYPIGSSRTKYTIPNSVISIGNSAFSYCKNLTDITIPKSVTTIGDGAFRGCDSLAGVTIPDSVTSIGDSVFSSCDSLASITIPDSVTSIGNEVCYDTSYYNKGDNWENDVLYIGNHLIRAKKTILGDYAIKPKTITISDNAFNNCDSLTGISIPNSVTTIGNSAFSSCGSLANITISDSVTTIGNSAFSSCGSLANITISDSVTTIGDYAFLYCESLATVYYSGTEDQWSKIGIGRYNECLTGINIIFNSINSDSSNPTGPDDNQPEEPVTPPEEPDEPNITPEISVTPFLSYFADYLKDYTSKIASVDMPCEALIAAGGMPSLTWNTVVESIKSLTNFKLGIDEKGYYEAILLDLLANTVTSVDYDKVITETTKEMANMLTNYLVDKNVDVTKEKLDSLDLKNLQNNLQDYLTASNIQITKECFDALIDGTESAAECLDKISTYAIAMQEGQHLVSALELMSEHSDYQPLTDCLNEVATLMNASPEEMAKTVAKKGVAAKTSQVVGDYILGVIKNIFPLETIKDIINIADYGCNLIFPTSTTSEQMYRIYTLYHIEDVAKASFKTASNNYNSADTIANAENVVSCYDMIVRVYEHQIAECNALAELLYAKGLLNAVKNFFSTNSSYDYQNALDWVDSYNVDLDVIKNYKQSAHEERGLSLGLLQPVRFIGIADGKVMGYSEQFVETGSSVTVPNYSILKSNKFLENLGTFEGWFYDLDCTIPVWATSIQVNKPLVLYSKISTKNAKQLQIKCPVNVEIYDDNNNVLLKIENDVLVQNSADFVVIIEGTQKCVLLPCDENYNIKLSATDSGTMNYSVTEIENGAYVRRYNFYDVSLYSGQEFSGNIESGLNVAQSDYALTTKTIENKTAEITPNEVIEKSEMQKLNISVNCVGNGIVSGNMLVTQGDYCVLEAIPNEDSDFDGWYCDNELLSSEKYFSFIVKENMSLTAVFSGDDTHEHSFGEWVVVKAPTATEEGIEECVCSVCGGKETRTIEKLNYIVGDVNGDGKITAADARIVLRISAKLDSMENYNLPLEAFDVTGDGKITAADARKVLRISAKLEK